MKEKNIVASKRKYPPEWEKQASTWLSWPHNEKEWGKKRLPKIKEFYIQLINIILKFQDVNLIFTNKEMLVETHCHASLQGTKHKLKKIIIPNNDIWIRDYGPFFVNVIASERSERSNLAFQPF